MLKHIHLPVMSVWRREIFKWNRADAEKDVKFSTTVPPLVTLGTVDPTNDDLKHLHWAAIHGRKKDILAVLQTGIWIDFPNDAGQTALFSATLRSQYGTARLLLQNGANPNEKSDTGMTPVHVACLKASLKAIGLMIGAGGDLRLHDNEGNGCIEWASYHPDPRKRMKMLEFLQKSQLFALNYSGDFVGNSNSLDRQPSILQMLRSKVGSQMSLDFGQEAGLRRVQSHGYGRVYYGGETASGMVSVIPLVTENQLRHDIEGISFESSSGFTMKSMLWNMTTITVKKVDVGLQKNNSVDLLISEVEQHSKLRHPNILLLMGLCQSSNFDNLMLAFERVSIGSLFHVLHEKSDHLPMTYIRDISNQVCQAILYMHGQNFIHCSLSSHAIYMVSMHQAKVGNLEYVMEMKKASAGRTCLVATSPHREHLFGWMAPEVMMGESPSAASDVYSFCCVLWEMITSELPWKSKTAKEMLELHKSDTDQILYPPKCVVLFREIIEQGLKKDRRSRPQDFMKLCCWFQGPLDKPPGWKPNTVDRFKTLQKESKERISVSSAFSSFFDLTGSFQKKQNSTSSTFSKDSSSSTSQLEQSSSNNQPVLEAAVFAKEVALEKAQEKTDSRDDSDSSNNHCVVPCQSMVSGVSDSRCSTLEKNSDDIADVDTVDSRKTAEGKKGRSQTTSSRNDGIFPATGSRLLDKIRFERSSSLSAVSKLERGSFRTASLPWQVSHGQLRLGSISPRASRGPDKDWNLSKTLPVKPASHSTDVKEFFRGDQPNVTNDKTFDRKTRKTRRHSPRRSLPLATNQLPHTRKVLPRSRSAAGDVVEIEKDVELSVPGSVRTLAEQFQAHLYNHSLRQSILKGSMTPNGTLFADLEISPTNLESPCGISEIPPEGRMKTNADSQDKEILTGSTKGSTESLTSVSFQDDSIPDEDCAQSLPLSSRNELNITYEVSVAKPAPVCPPRSSHLQSKLVQIQAKPDIVQNSGAFRIIGSEVSGTESSHSDDCHNTYIVPTKQTQFLPSTLPGADISSHPFDFQDYYIDDDYTGFSDDDHSEQESILSGNSKSSHVTDRSRRKLRDCVWRGDNRKGTDRNRPIKVKSNELIRTPQWFVEQKQTEQLRNSCQALHSRPSGKQQLKAKRSSYIKYDEWFENKWDGENECQEDAQNTCKELKWKQSKTINTSGNDIIHAEERLNQPDSDAEDRGSNVNEEMRVFEEQRETNQKWEKYWEGPQPKPRKYSSRMEKDCIRRVYEMKSQLRNNVPAQEKYLYEDGHNTHCYYEDDLGGIHHPASEPEQCDRLSDLQENEDGALMGSLLDSYSSRESSMSTVVERPVTNTWQLPACTSITSDHGYDENDTTLLAEDVADQGRCVSQDFEPNPQPEFETHGCADEDEEGLLAGSNPVLTGSPRQCTMRKIFLGPCSGTQGYTSTLRVESSLEKPGLHHVTHTARDTNTGLTQTVHEETVQAEILRTTMDIQ